MNAIIFLAITLTLATVTVAKNYEEMDTTTILKEIKNIMKMHKNKNIGVKEANNGVIRSLFQPLAATPYMGTGYYNLQVFSDSKCSNQVISDNVLLNTCTQSTTGAYTKSTASTNGGNITLSIVSYSDSECAKKIKSLATHSNPSGCTISGTSDSSSYIADISVISYKVSLISTISNPTTDQAIITT
jgi:hypothetical protein